MGANYSKLAKKYNLPTFKELDKEFDIGSIDESSFPLRDIRKKMAEKLEFLGDILGEILQPNPDSIVGMYECKFFGDDEKTKIFDIYKEVQTLLRIYTLCQFAVEEKEDGEWIHTVYSAWKHLKKRSLPFMEKLKETWKEGIKTTTELRYLG